ncbi:MAG: hypothetical protein HUU29_04205 [Planctomycetaceae bacterium]|nr:hypothetical protein [Planctomycetaceae bacterium]
MSGAGIDITKSLGVMVEIERSGMEYYAGRAAILPGYDHTPDSPATHGASTDLAKALAGTPSSLRRKGAIVSIPGRDVMFRMAAIGSSDPASVRAIVRLEVDTMTSGDVKMLASHQRIEAPDGTPMALIGVAREALVEHYAETLKHAGLSCVGFVPNPVALYQCYLMSGDLTYEGTMMVANIGETSTDVILVSGGNLILARTLNTGVEAIVERIATDVGTDHHQAREGLFSRVNIKPGVANENVSGDRVVLAAQDAAARLYAQLNSVITMGRAQLQAPGLDAGRIAICGPGASIRGMREFLMSRFRKTVDTLNPLSGLDTSKLDETAAATLKRYAYALAIPLGLARIAADGAAGTLVFEPPSLILRRIFFQRTVWLYAGMLVLVAALAAALVFSSHASTAASEVKRQASDLAAGYTAHHLALAPRPLPPGASVQDRVMAMAEVNRELLIAEQRLYELCEARRPGLDAVRLYNDLAASWPKDAMLTFYGLVPGAAASANPEPVVTIKLFLSNASPDIMKLYGSIRDTLKAHELVESVTPSVLTDVSDGSGKTATITVKLRDAGELFGEAREPQPEEAGS